MTLHVTVYKEGESHNVKGVKCEAVRIKYSDLDKYLSNGHVQSVKDLYPEVETETTEPPVETDPEVETETTEPPVEKPKARRGRKPANNTDKEG